MLVVVENYVHVGYDYARPETYWRALYSVADGEVRHYPYSRRPLRIFFILTSEFAEVIYHTTNTSTKILQILEALLVVWLFG